VKSRPRKPTFGVARAIPWPRSAAGAAFVLFVALWPLPVLADGGAAGSDTGVFARALTHGTLAALGVSFGCGLLTSLTPCVYPMIAITVSVFGAKEAATRLHGVLLSSSFVFGIVCLFAPMGVASALLGRGFGGALGSLPVVAAIAIVFSLLAASLFGAFEIALPQGLSNRLSGVGGTGYAGAFLLGLVCGLLAAPCVGPFLFGLLGWIASTRNVALGSAAMTSYGLGLGTLFFVVGVFAVNLPKAGAWMIGVKWVGGVVLAYLALSYVRDALPREALSRWVRPGAPYGVAGMVLLAIGILLACAHVAAERRRSSIAHLSKLAKLASIVPAIAGLFMVVSWWHMHLPAMKWESDESAALDLASIAHKPLLIDFGASWCGACKELDERTFPDPRVRAEGERFVALHVDATNEDDPEVARVRRKYGATEGLPVVLLFGTDGREAFRFTEFVPPDRFVSALAQVR
jgi:thiol:disulfide interchange protein DsbD